VGDGYTGTGDLSEREPFLQLIQRDATSKLPGEWRFQDASASRPVQGGDVGGSNSTNNQVSERELPPTKSPSTKSKQGLAKLNSC